jgi:hypothetical protein
VDEGSEARLGLLEAVARVLAVGKHVSVVLTSTGLAAL